ncbi:1,2-dihydroxy-3-keto-5-methylthiopentene dioxygenase 2 [Camellia lanceoleosa]|nr:1,2-dihydroxy-3-keto-5-methylthiopentene dioxygenase 2 [Camellia lanceoleosa]
MTDQRCSRQRQHSASANSESSYSGSANESSYSGSSDESSEESTRIIPDPPMSWYPPGSLPSASSSTGSTHDTTAGIIIVEFSPLKNIEDAIQCALDVNDGKIFGIIIQLNSFSSPAFLRCFARFLSPLNLSAMWLFIGDSIWTPFNCPHDHLPERKEYVQNVVHTEVANHAVNAAAA